MHPGPGRGVTTLLLAWVMLLGALGAAMVEAPAAHAAAGSRIGQVLVDGAPALAVTAPLPQPGQGPAIRRYRDSGQFASDRAAIAYAAMAAVDRIAAQSCGTQPDVCRAQRLAVVLDVDDTLLDWYSVYRAHRFAPTAQQRRHAVSTCATPVIAPMRRMAQRAVDQGFAIVVITGRRESARQATEACLRRRGLPQPDILVMRGAADHATPAADFKSRSRQQLTDAGWTLVLTVGDQVGDLAGPDSLERFWLPNPLYRTR